MRGITAFDADVLIYAADHEHPFQGALAALLEEAGAEDRAIGSLLLMPEILPKPLRAGPASTEVARLIQLLGRLRLLPMDGVIANLSVTLGAKYGLRAPDAVHLATAIAAGADRFLTNNRKDFGDRIHEIDVVFPEALG
ncbi:MULTISPECIES: type II toxin-antitoxin system VapC family toxin [unclassified Microbacterium]|uniref:type II toxin-antitoxin system VapC family toxin n=1 Tax=unclassified Microbacterium TaxID=2609290 RepID=UPI001AC963C1|nr:MULTISPECIES: PIN domain-containing protein [unclassified Microbacterium]MBN9156773.1 PIN domain-containing protein [Microbacterium sp.]MBS1898636.1 PIN domain-containing protein [Actinomycetota bacterium]